MTELGLFVADRHLPLARVVERIAPLHDRVCPRQVLGARIGLYGGEILGLDLPRGITDKRLLVFVETDGCFVDGVWGATGCTVGHRTLRVVDHGKVAATFIDTLSDRSVRIWPRPGARERALAYATAATAATDRWHAQREGYALMPVEELLEWRRVELAVPLEEILSRPGVRAVCAGCGEEVMNDREVKVLGKPYCRACAGEAYLLGAPRSAIQGARDFQAPSAPNTNSGGLIAVVGASTA